MGVAKIDMFKRVNVPSALDRVIDELAKRKRELVSALAAPTDKTEFGYGRLCGQYQEIVFIESVLDHCLDESDPVRGRHEES